MKESPYNAQLVLEQPLDQGKWILLRKITFNDPSGKQREWEMAVRTTRTETTGLDAVCILALLRNAEADSPRLVLVKQFRPPCNNVVVELPAGLIDPNESVETTAERELLEETGYVGRVVRLSHTAGPLFSDPGLTNVNLALVTMEIDATDERNINPQPLLEDCEYIDVAALPLKGLMKSLAQMCAAEGCVLDSRLYHFAEGLRLGELIQRSVVEASV
ncbi:hypothetical protein METBISCDRAFT_23411 [Metschnikowia bicuspidata]|uniref:Nudix hydrolase domain-containing protein n=1 Tax=Metschnikowia bicuspidata TaxID=27322 RepID=A0A4P9ZBT2_9ASCO|nr:hypothetical protein METBISCDRAFT_23411 [Metschnikowia bicuspidata]